MNQISVPVSLGELLDKITILETKAERMSDPGKLNNVRTELDLLNAIWSQTMTNSPDIKEQRSRLKAVNEKLWDIEDRIRIKERSQSFDAEFIELARSVYFENDERAAIKRKINVMLGSALIEEKSYQDYRTKQ